MQNWKTSIAGIVGALVVISRYVGLEIPDDVQNALVALCVAVLGIFAKDFNVSSTKTF